MNRLEEFAKVLVDHSTKIEEGDEVYIYLESIEGLELFEEVRQQVIQRGGLPHEHILYDSQLSSEGLDRYYANNASFEQLRTVSKAKKAEMENIDAYIRIGGASNTRELSDVPPERISIRKKACEELMNERLKKKWVVTRYPTTGMAQEADMPTDEMKDYLFNIVNNTDWEALKEKNQKIKEVFDGAEEVIIEDHNTELSLSLKGREAVTSEGEFNIPDGEIFFAPIKDSINGTIKFSYPALAQGKEVNDIELVFEDGEIVDYSASKHEEYLKSMIETDEGSKFVGEFGIGTNSEITQYMKNTLFDEKIEGSIHLALGRAYDKCLPEGEDGNSSGIHWDLVKDLRERKSGGKIIVDGTTVQENGKWLIDI